MKQKGLINYPNTFYLNESNRKDYESCHIDDFKEFFPEEKYLVRQYDLYTEDGYHLALFRIQNHTLHKGSFSEDKVPVLFLPGAGDDGVCEAFTNGPKLSFGYVLADQGFDFWAANFRGCRFSRKHRELEIDQPEFWEGMTFDHRDEYDIPCFVNKVAEVTGKKMAVIGYSLSCINILLVLAEDQTRQKIVDHVFSYQLFAPGFLFKTTESEFKNFLNSYLAKLETEGRLYGSLGNRNWEKDCLRVIDPSTHNFEKNKEISLKFFDESTDYINWEHHHQIAGVTPSYKSYVNWKQWYQFYQESSLDSIRIRKYDYGLDNQKKYGQEEPPEYNSSNIVDRLTIYQGGKDQLFNADCLDLLVSSLDQAEVEVVTIEGWGHGGFIFTNSIEPFLDLVKRIMRDKEVQGRV